MALETNLEANWSMEGNSNDNKGSNNGSDTAMTYNNSYGKYLQGALFNGTTSKILLSSAPSIQTPPFTWAGWIKVPSYGVEYIIAGGTAHEPNIFLDGAGKIHFGDYGTADVAANTAIGTGAFAFFAVTYQGTTPHFYLNGQPDGTPSFTFTPVTGTFYFGDDGTGSNRFTGDLDEWSMWSRVLSDAEILQLYASGGGMHFNGSIFVNNNPSSIKSINGLAQAFVKSINGLVIASVKSFNGLS